MTKLTLALALICLAAPALAALDGRLGTACLSDAACTDNAMTGDAASINGLTFAAFSDTTGWPAIGPYGVAQWACAPDMARPSTSRVACTEGMK